jgi:hypothetical protein
MAVTINGSGQLIVQILQSVKTDTQTTTSATYVDITSLSVTITPTSASNRILVMARINSIGCSNDQGPMVNLVRNSTTITSSTAGGATDTGDAWAIGGGGGMADNDRKMTSCALDFIDSPATTSATTYKMQLKVAGGATGTVNRWGLNNDLATVSSITVMEISG